MSAERWLSAERLERITGKPHAEGQWIDLGSLPRGLPRKSPAVMTDISAYRSTIDGSMISSRSTHRDHLRAHGCVELGNDVSGGPATKDWSPSAADIVADIKRAAEQGAPPGMHAALHEAQHALDDAI